MADQARLPELAQVFIAPHRYALDAFAVGWQFRERSGGAVPLRRKTEDLCGAQKYQR